MSVTIDEMLKGSGVTLKKLHFHHLQSKRREVKYLRKKLLSYKVEQS